MTSDTAKDAFFIGGAWVPAAGRAAIPVVDPATEEQVATVPAGTEEDIDAAVAAARAAFPAWSATSADERARLLSATADALEARTDEIARMISGEMGTPLSFSVAVQVGNPVRVLRTYAELLATYAFEEQIGNSLVVKEPIGVVAAITPWNYPLHQVVAKVAAALAAGCTVVLKPSEVAPLSAYALAEIFEQVGLPAGVFNVVTGLGPIVGERIAERWLRERGWRVVQRRFRSGHRDIDLVVEQDGLIAFVEVKARRGDRFGDPVAAVNWKKQKELGRSARVWIDRHGRPLEAYRFDVVGVIYGPGPPEIVHIENAFHVR